MTDPQPSSQPASWRIILAFLLDFVMSFAVFGYIVASLSGALTPNGFYLEGGPALLCFGLMIAYFVIANRFLGGTLWKHILKARRTD